MTPGQSPGKLDEIKMAAEYRLDILSPAGVLLAQLSRESGHSEPTKKSFNWLVYTNSVNAPGLLRFELPGGHLAISSLTDKAQVEIWRRDRAAELDWYRDFAGLFRSFQYQYDPPSQYIATCPSQMAMLQWRHIAYAAGVVNRSKFTSTAAETIAKLLVQYNITSDATTGNDRKRDGTGDPAPYISIETDAAGGNSLDWYCFGDNLLSTLRELAGVGGGDFDLVKTGAQAWEYRWYAGQLGVDRTATVVFALERGNMGSPVYSRDRRGEKTVAIVAGQGEGTDRDFEIRTSDDYSATSDIELFVDARDIDKGDANALGTRGDNKLDEYKSREIFDFRVLQAPSTRYGLNYGLGDLVTVINPFTGASITQKIVSTTIDLAADGQEIIDVEMETPP